MKKHNAALIWSDIVGHRRHNHYPVVTADFLYLRINEHEKKRIEKIKEKEEVEGGLDFAVIIVGKPIKANTVLKLLNLQQRKYRHMQWVGKIIMCVDLNAFFPSCEELRDTSLIGKPHAVIMTDQQKNSIMLQKIDAPYQKDVMPTGESSQATNQQVSTRAQNR